MTLEDRQIRHSGPLAARPWSKQFTVFTLLVMCIVSPLFGGATAYLAFQWSPLPQEQQGHWFLSFVAALASLLTGTFFWWRVVIRPRRLTPGRGAWAGMAGSLTAHPLTWLFVLGIGYLTNNIRLLLLNPTGLLWSVAFFSFFSLIIVGWLTTSVGALAGAGVAWALARLQPRFD